MSINRVVGVYPLFNTGGICVHAIDDVEDEVLASMNGKDPEWCDITEQDIEGEMESGFCFGSIFVPFSQVMRV